MSQKENTSDEEEYRKLTDTGAVTIPADCRGDETGYMIKQTEDGRIILIPAHKEEKITIAQANE
ncbi:hypothetical protein PNQ29_00655 [Halobacterium salinarum]|uniref:hypothetical protein n=1 Tax=Halobacterium salinarum TaxID=2242 RepID=UPI002554F473|nr:hypothetical protein [Halobacterium salinarum]MDL0118270.1 hypothetical protein [Halobacterium salinarum]